jgi:hypothetical protein
MVNLLEEALGHQAAVALPDAYRADAWLLVESDKAAGHQGPVGGPGGGAR